MNEIESGIKNIIRVGEFLVATTYGYLDGIYFSSIDNIHWLPFNEGLPGRFNYELYADTNYIYTGTDGHGIWRRKIQDLITTSTESTPSTKGFTIFPNPANDSFIIRLDSHSTGRGTLVIYDVNGERCFTQDIILDQESEVRTEGLPSGIYFVQVYSEEVTFSSKIIIQK